ncbi:SDR family oxidoreductase [Vibrio hippocampi]|uniref:Short-chain dehydrogenase n=1 Tax=Vibrio hippocampi TaxID=654686 RepID=A0ABM8ZGA0_9VIBR|nr:SDR family oxidoreductase [Vibrio hippocampi]CAH0525488.1 hypothetical protein VHP8226_01013 [Vibrio hippocampi]
MVIKDSVVVITSAATPLGAMFATHFSRLDAHVIVCDTNIQGLKDTFSRCREITSKVDMMALNDVSLSAVDDLFNGIETKLGRSPNILVNHWTALPRLSFTDTLSGAQFIQQFSLLASRLFLFGQVAAERMASHQSGVIVNVVAQEPDQKQSDIDSTTSMVTGFTKSWAKELKIHNIRVGGIIPVSTHNYSVSVNWAKFQDELTRTTEYIVTNDYFSGRVVSTDG